MKQQEFQAIKDQLDAIESRFGLIARVVSMRDDAAQIAKIETIQSIRLEVTLVDPKTKSTWNKQIWIEKHNPFFARTVKEIREMFAGISREANDQFSSL